MNKVITKALFAFTVLFASSATTLAVCPDYQKYQAAAQTIERRIKENKETIGFYTRMLSGNYLDAFAKKEALNSLQIYQSDLQAAELELDKAQKNLATCLAS